MDLSLARNLSAGIAEFGVPLPLVRDIYTTREYYSQGAGLTRPMDSLSICLGHTHNCLVFIYSGIPLIEPKYSVMLNITDHQVLKGKKYFQQPF